MAHVLEGKTAVITGAADGIGKCILKCFLEEGCQCVAADKDEDRLAALTAEFAPWGGQLRTVEVDVTDRAQVEEMVAFARRSFGKMDVLVNNVGIMDNLLPVAEMEDDVWEQVLRVNLTGIMYGCREAVRYFLETGLKGSIINTASLSGLCAGRGGCAYTTSKFAVVGLTKNIAFMYADTGIRCNALCPGDTDSNVGEGMRRPSVRGMSKYTSGCAGSPRSGKPEEVAAAALFLASDGASFINGETLTIDGGWSAY